MWNQACSQSPAGTTSHKAVISKRAFLQILPCTVSQLLSASEVGSDSSFVICDSELNQVSVVGIIRGCAPFVTNIQYSVDDMTGPPLQVKQWVNLKDCAPMTRVPPGSYVKVIGSLRSFRGQRMLLAMDIRSIKDLNEITSHMLEVVEAHMKLCGKAYDVNMNLTASSSSGRVSGNNEEHEGLLPNGFSIVQNQVFNVVRKFSVQFEGISLNDLKSQLEDISMRNIRRALTFLIDEGHVFTTVDEQHYKSTAL
ncbi:replication protein A 32 kDa subunit-like [Notolabrus celidotus]|uniref:replication protein A 32 kDa subunit-like n=1 Tax=Notolabrus celidotus TaxID=1203425 RepID=UPI001490707E|nr:replication protein A 32 kDa subunit-like [Notolabrus celidotus]